MRADNSAHLAEYAQQRRLACIERVHAVLDALERDGGAVTVAGVAARARVSRTFLCDAAQAPLLARLRDLDDKQPTTGRPALPDQQRITTKSHETVVRWERYGRPTAGCTRRTNGSATNSRSRSDSSATFAAASRSNEYF